MSALDERPTWTFLTNHAHVLNCIAEDPEARLRDIAARVGITERGAQTIVADLVRGGYVTRTRVGRRNQYEVHPDLPFRHPIEQDHQVGELLGLLGLVEAKGKAARPNGRTAPKAATSKAAKPKDASKPAAASRAAAARPSGRATAGRAG